MMFVPLVPVSEIKETGEELSCAECGRVFTENEEGVFWVDDYFCETCSVELAGAAEQEAEQFAKEIAKIHEIARDLIETSFAARLSIH